MLLHASLQSFVPRDLSSFLYYILPLLPLSPRQPVTAFTQGNRNGSLTLGLILQPIADQLGVTQSQLALAWCLKNQNVSSVITGASNPQQIIENVQALKVLDQLTPEVMKNIDDIVGKIELAPARQD